jgi:AcrR family transcriptional regulator
MVERGTVMDATVKERATSECRTASGGRERILAVAREAFATRGYADVSMQEIAGAAGLTKAAIYYHFADKEALFQEVLIAEVDRIAAGVAAELAAGASLHERLARVVRFALETSRGDFGRLLSDAHRYCDRARLGAIHERVSRPYALIREAFAQALARGEIRPVDLDVTLALFLWMLSGLMKGSDVGPRIDLPPQTLATIVADMVMKGVGTESR